MLFLKQSPVEGNGKLEALNSAILFCCVTLLCLLVAGVGSGGGVRRGQEGEGPRLASLSTVLGMNPLPARPSSPPRSGPASPAPGPFPDAGRPVLAGVPSGAWCPSPSAPRSRAVCAAGAGHGAGPERRSRPEPGPLPGPGSPLGLQIQPKKVVLHVISPFSLVSDDNHCSSQLGSPLLRAR